mmetsp:Transcript_15371/g.23149  ORF Transcript_15371/g.23149 Transcript_15371/m.23149 type:complete len:214 (+) Transcript_15371:75-716(+)
MVFFFESSEGYVIYMGADKYENEDLIKYGLPEDMWFHVDDLSSAHVYLRLRKDQKLEDVSPETIMECAQLVKANSIEGCKKKEVDVVYTRWRNLHKTPSMEVGAIGFHDRSKVRKMKVVKDNSIVNALNRTKVERFPDLAALQEERAKVFRAEQKEKKRQAALAEKLAKKEREEQAKLRSYESLMQSEQMMSNVDMTSDVTDSAAKDYEDDFM